MRRLVLMICGLLTYAMASAQQEEFTFQHISIEHGLSQNTVFAITQDARGFMWFGTREGLNRYDSRRIKSYLRQSPKGSNISDYSINSLLSDSRGRLWAGTSVGLNLYDPNSDRFDQVNTIAQGEPVDNEGAATCLLEDSRKDIWIGTHDGLKLLTTNDAGFSFRTFNRQSGHNIISDDVRAVFEDSSGVLWIGTANGLSRLVITGNDTYAFTSFDFPPTIARKNDEIRAIAEYENGVLLIGTENTGLLSFDPSNGTFTKLHWLAERNSEPEAVRVIQADKTRGVYLIGTIGGLYIADPGRNEFKSVRNLPGVPNSLSDNSVRSLFVDRDGSMWVGTFHGGVNFYSPQLARFGQITPHDELSFKIASALATDEANNLWIGTEGSGLFLVDPQGKLIRHFRHLKNDRNSLSHNNIKCLLLEEKGIWIGTLKGLNYYDFRSQQFTVFSPQPDNEKALPDDAIYDLAKDGEGNIWIATYRGGLTMLDRRTGTFTTYTNVVGDPTSLSAEGAISVLIDSRENMWVGTTGGLNLKSKGTGIFRRYIHDPADTTSLSSNYIMFVFEDSRQRLWVGTRSNGLNLLASETGRFKRLGTNNGLSGNTTFDMKEDRKGYLWISTDNGITRLDPRDFSMHNYGRNDGLICKQFNANSTSIDKTGKFYFGGNNGIVLFNPENISDNAIVPDVRFVGLKVFNKEMNINYSKEITLRHDQNVFTFDFAVLNYINPGKNQFAYKLVGFEDHWNETPDPVVTYMNLPPGSYTLFVRGSNNDGVWSETPLSVRLQITPPPWKSWWAYTIYGCLVVGMLLAWTRFNRKRMALEHELEIEHIELRKQEEVHQAKLRFFANIVHEIRTPLTLMTGPVDRLLSESTGDQQAKKDLSLLKANTGRLDRLLNQLLDFHKQETGNVQLKVQEENIVEFIDETLLSFKDYSQSRKVTLGFHAAEAVVPLWFDREELSKVFFNLLVNAFKFTPGGGTIAISVSKEGTDHVKIVVQDTGLGIPASHLERIFHRFYQAENSGVNGAGVGIGLALAKGIIDLHHGTITVDSKEATNDETGYTTFSITLRTGNSHFSADQLREHHIDVDGIQIAFEPEHSEGEVLNKPSPNAGRALILLVEDNDEIRSYMRDVLAEHYEVVETADGHHGLEAAVERLPDLVLSDVMMPRMDGLELTRKLKNDQRTSHIPVILLTARGALNYQLEGFETGADDYLTKPVNRKLLLARIRTCLANREKLKVKYGRIVTFQPKAEELGNPEDQFLQKLMTVLENNIMDPGFNVAKLALEIGMSRPVLFRKIKMLTGLSVIDLIRNVRLKKAELLLRQKKLSISEVAFHVGFTDPKYFSKSFRSVYGKSPSQFLEES